ncbi:hypothetical protein ACFLYU_04235 [Candidatus Dependentiae bacterium]
MKKYSNVFLISVVLITSYANNSFAMKNTKEEPVRAPIPQKVDRIKNSDNNRPKQFDVIHNALRNAINNKKQTPKEKILRLKNVFSISNILAVKEYCESNTFYKLPKNICDVIDEECNNDIDNEMIEKFVKNNIDKKGWLEIEKELDNEFEKGIVKKEVLKRLENRYKNRQLHMIHKHIDENIKKKEWTELEKELVKKFKKEHIDQCKRDKQKLIEDASKKQIKDYVNKNISKKSWNQIRQDLIVLGFRENQTSFLLEENEQIALIKNYISKNSGGKNDREIKNALIAKGFEQECVHKILEEKNNKKNKWLNKFVKPKKNNQKPVAPVVKPNNKKPKRSKKKKLRKKKQPSRQAFNPVSAIKKAKQKINKPKEKTKNKKLVKKQPRIFSTLGSGNRGSENDKGKPKASIFSRLFGFFKTSKAVQYTVLFSAVSIAFISAYNLLGALFSR